MIKKIVILLAFGLILGIGLSGFVLAGFNRASAAQSRPAAVIGGVAPDFAINTLSGSKIQLSQFRGKPVLVNFWATWCEPCKVEMPLIEQYYEKNSKNLVVLAIDSDESAADVTSFIQGFKISFTILVDSNGSIADLYRVDGFPTSFFIDPDGKIQAERIGSLSEDTIGRYLASVGVNP